MNADSYLMKHNFDQQQIETIKQYGEIRSYKKGSLYLNQGEICNRIGLVIDGIFYAYDIDQKGNKNIFRFFYNPVFYLVVDYKSYVQNTLSEYVIEALEDSKVFVFSKDKIEYLNTLLPKFADLYKHEMEQMLIHMIHTIRIFQNSNTLVRMKLLKESSPELFMKVPYSYLASYLGMHRNTFSDAMKRL